MYELQQWGMWVRMGNDRLRVRSAWAIIMRNNVQGRGLPFLLCDDDALRIDRAVSALKRHNQVLGRIVIMRYVQRKTLREIAQEYLTPLEYPQGGDRLVHHSAVARMLEIAHQFIYNFLQ